MNWQEIIEHATEATETAQQAVLYDDALLHQDTSRYELFVFHCPRGRYNLEWKGMINEDSNGQLYVNVVGGRGDHFLSDENSLLLPGSHEMELEGYYTDRNEVIAFLVNTTLGTHDTQYIRLIEQ